MTPEFMEVCPAPYHQIVAPTTHVWGWEIVVYLFLGGLVAGLLVLTAALELKRGERPAARGLQWAPFVALGLISVGMVALLLDLHYKVHFWRFYLAFQPASPMSWGAWILLIIYPAGRLLGLGSLDGATRGRLVDWVGRRLRFLRAPLEAAIALADRRRRGILWTSIATGIGLGIYTGLLLGTMVARIQWNSAVLGPLFLASGLSTGAALLLFLRPSDSERHTLVRWDTLAILVELFFIALMLVSFAGGNQTAQMAGDNLMGGKWTAAFWTFVVILGLAAPLLMNTFEIRRNLAMTLLTPALVLIGGVALRAILLAAGQESCFCEIQRTLALAP